MGSSLPPRSIYPHLIWIFPDFQVQVKCHRWKTAITEPLVSPSQGAKCSTDTVRVRASLPSSQMQWGKGLVLEGKLGKYL